jgi:hypothetical protein
VHVLDDVEHGRGGTEPVHEVQHRLEQAELRGGGEVRGPGRHGRHETRDEAGELRQAFELEVQRAGAVEAAKGLGQRRERERVTGHRDAGAREQRHAFGLHQLADQPGLAHAGLTADHEHSRLARRGAADRRPEHPEAVVTSDQRRRWTSHHHLSMTGRATRVTPVSYRLVRT